MKVGCSYQKHSNFMSSFCTFWNFHDYVVLTRAAVRTSQFCLKFNILMVRSDWGKGSGSGGKQSRVGQKLAYFRPTLLYSPSLPLSPNEPSRISVSAILWQLFPWVTHSHDCEKFVGTSVSEFAFRERKRRKNKLKHGSSTQEVSTSPGIPSSGSAGQRPKKAKDVQLSIEKVCTMHCFHFML